MEQLDTFLAHYGVKGMKWGVHRDRTPTAVEVKTRPGKKVKTSGGKHQSASEDAIRAAKIRQQAKKSTTDSLSNKELQELVSRMNLEQQYRNLNHNNVNAGMKATRTILGLVGDKEVGQLQGAAGTRVPSQHRAKSDFGVKAGVGLAKTFTGTGGGGKKK